MIVVKFGGHAMTDSHGEFAQAIADATSEGVEIVIVHGGGPQIGAALEVAGLPTEFVGGFRVTTQEIFAVVERVLAKEIGPAVVQSLESKGVNAVALSGRDSKTLVAEELTALVDGTPVNLGRVGTIIAVNPAEIRKSIASGHLPVISPIATDAHGVDGFNVNGDLAAAAIAGALSAQWLIIMTDVPGIYRNWPDKGSLISEISVAELQSIKATFTEGMAPKVQSCLDAISAGASAVRIIDGTDPLALKNALLGVGGTLVVA